MTPSVGWELVRRGHLRRGLRLTPLAAGAVSVVAFLVSRRGGSPDALGDLRVAALLLTLGSGYVLDDGAAGILQASPYALARRVRLRIAAAAVLLVPAWASLLAGLLRSARPSDRWTLGLGLTVEFAAVLTVVWAIAAVARRRGVDHPGVVTGPALLASLFLMSSLARAPMLVGLGPDWVPAHLRWSAVLAGAAAVLAVAVGDPAADWRRSGERYLKKLGAS
ncbi:hypothetical protein [Actinoplanes sp. NPDC049265]|uniref:hypothetical protein n=1 Tax=Actinoplanes sp. NPDC049265 TaxID=3363902 RepID=UPI003711E1D7